MYNNFSVLSWVGEKKELLWEIFLTDVSIELWTFYSLIYKKITYSFMWGLARRKAILLSLSQ